MKKRFRPACKTAVVTIGKDRLRIAWTNSGIAAVERETLTTKRDLKRRVKMDLVEASPPPVFRQFLVLATKGKAEEVPVDLAWARDFERDVLEATRRIPYGQTRSYSWLAREARRPLAVRAAATTMARNPLWLLVPCHRVIHADGSIGSYGNGAVGQARKRALLEQEGVRLASPTPRAKKRSEKQARTTHR